MSPLVRSRPSSPPSATPPAAAAVPVPALAAAELGDDDLEQVVGGLERVYVPGRVVTG